MVANGEEYDLTQKVFLAEKKCRLLQNVMYVDCCKQTLGATLQIPAHLTTHSAKS